MYIYCAKDKKIKNGLLTSKKHMAVLHHILSETTFLRNEKVALKRFCKRDARKILNALTPLTNYIPVSMEWFPNIIVERSWSAHLVLFKEEPDVVNAFRSVLGHELTHLEKRDISMRMIRPFKPNSKDRRFARWVNEVHCDFNGAAIAFDNDLCKSISAMKYMERHKMIACGTDKEYSSHPSRALRTKYISMKCFDSTLIAEIAKDAGCANDALIAMVANHFATITLH